MLDFPVLRGVKKNIVACANRKTLNQPAHPRFNQVLNGSYKQTVNPKN